jgi:hypothetical protein
LNHVPPLFLPLPPSLSVRNLVKFTDTADDDICGASMSLKYNSNLISIWNRIAPDTLPTSAITPPRGSLPFAKVSEQVAEESPLEKGVEKMKEEILRGLSEELSPQGWYYRVFFFLIWGESNGRCIVVIETSKVREMGKLGIKRWKVSGYRRMIDVLVLLIKIRGRAHASERGIVELI